MRIILRIILLALVALVMIAVAIAWLWNSAESGTVQLEIVRSLLQLGFVVVLGTAITAAIKVFEQDKEAKARSQEQERIRAQDAAALRVDYLRRAGSAYRSIKAVRRNLRAAGLSRRYRQPPNFVRKQQLERYQNEMWRLNEAQLELEALKIEASSLPQYHELSELGPALEKMEKYLREILRERERFERDLAEENEVPFSEFERLDEFTDSAGARGKPTEYQLRRDFAKPYDRVITLISKNLRVDSA